VQDRAHAGWQQNQESSPTKKKLYADGIRVEHSVAILAVVLLDLAGFSHC